MSGDFLQNLYLMIGFFVAFTAVMGMFIAFLWRAIQQIAGDIRRMEKGVRRELRGLSSWEFGGLSREVRELRKGVRRLRKDMQEVKDLLGIESEFCPERSRSGTGDGGRGR